MVAFGIPYNAKYHQRTAVTRNASLHFTLCTLWPLTASQTIKHIDIWKWLLVGVVIWVNTPLMSNQWTLGSCPSTSNGCFCSLRRAKAIPASLDWSVLAAKLHSQHGGIHTMNKSAKQCYYQPAAHEACGRLVLSYKFEMDTEKQRQRRHVVARWTESGNSSFSWYLQSRYPTENSCQESCWVDRSIQGPADC